MISILVLGGEYGNAIAGVFDLEMRDGNNATPFEGSFQFGLLGVELMAEGRLGEEKPNAPSYLILGRYSTLSMATTLGILWGRPQFQITQTEHFVLAFRKRTVRN